jgi:hypothetical protein
MLPRKGEEVNVTPQLTVPDTHKCLLCHVLEVNGGEKRANVGLGVAKCP